MKKVLAIVCVLAVCLMMMAGCTQPTTDSITGEKTKENMKIGIIQLAEHVALDAATQGFIDTLVAEGFSAENIDLQNAQGEQSNCGIIANKFVNDKVDLILAVATPAALAAAQATKDIPILITAVTDPQSAGLVVSNEDPQTNVSGTSDMNPIKDQVEMVFEFVPEAKNIGIMFCSSEDNSQLQADLAKVEFEAKGATVKYYTAADSSEIQAVTQSAVGKVDAIYIPTDNLFASAMDTVALVSGPNKIPVICGEAGMVNKGGLATYAIDYYALGAQTGNQAIDILVNGADVTKMPIAYSPAEDLAITVNEENAATIGIEIPEKYKAK